MASPHPSNIKRLSLLLVIIAAIGAYFAGGVEIREAGFQLAPYVNNYPQAAPAQKIFLGDKVQLTFKVKNNSLRSYAPLALKLHFSQHVRITAPVEVADAGEYVLEIPALGAFAEHSASLVITAVQSGYLSVDAQISKDARKLELEIEPRPIDATPRVPGDIISYLGDKAVAYCKEQVPCSHLDKTGICRKYPDSPESQKCLEEQSAKLFSGCGAAPQNNAEVDPWEACLFKKYGFAK